MWDKDTYNFMEFVKKKCEMVVEAERLKAELPEGTLVVHKRKGKDQYYWQKWKNGHCVQNHLNFSSDNDLISKLERKKELQSLFKSARRWNKLLKELTPVIKQVISEFQVPTFETNKIYYSEKINNSKNLTKKTLHGEFVRSLSEALIADWLFYMKIPYRYEKRLIVCDESFYPDFTVINPLNGKEVYVEFLGLDSEEYLNTWNKKLSRYNQMGIFEGDRLLVITKEQNDFVHSILEQTFTLKRYIPIMDFLNIV